MAYSMQGYRTVMDTRRKQIQCIDSLEEVEISDYGMGK
jgi:hypothetical protein